jgi:hypothetical protein
MLCPKCGYKRSKKEDELTPKTDCPSCGIIYNKFEKKTFQQKPKESQGDNSSPEEEPVRFSYKYAGIAALLIFCFFIYAGYSSNEDSKNYSSSTSSSNNYTNVSTPAVSSTGEWYENGTLHRANIQQWNSASYANKVATSADMAISHSKVSGKVRNSGNMSTLRPYAFELLTCINETSAGKGYETMKISEIAAMCIILMKW